MRYSLTVVVVITLAVVATSAAHAYLDARCRRDTSWYSRILNNETRFDLIVLGGGTAGAVTATRHAHTHDSVLLLEVNVRLPQHAIAEWVRLFPRQATETYSSSVTFMKQLTVVAISTITYLKNVFPEDSYTTENFGGIRLRVLKKKCRHELAQFVSTSLMQAFEAFDKKYLHQLVICFYDGECKKENVVEYHIFEYLYNSEEVTMQLHSKHRDGKSTRYSFTNVREKTLHLIRACVVIMQACQAEMPDTFDVSLRLYYNEDAPEGYQAPGYQEPPAEEEDHLAPTLGDVVTLGCVETPYHKVTARTYIKDTMGSSYEANPTQNPPELSANYEDDFEMSNGVRCPCNRVDKDPTHVLLTCSYCNTQQHGACFGVLRNTTPRTHCCVACTDDTRPATDDKLLPLTDKKRECLCIFRRALEWCANLESVSAELLSTHFALSPTNAAKLLRLLDSHHLLDTAPDHDLVTPRKIIKDQLEIVISKFFQNENEENNMVDRLIAETLSSQPDPIGDVLSPLEKVTLENASAFSKVVEPINTVHTENDETLKQYKEVLIADVAKENELPLSGSHNIDLNVGKRNKRKNARTKGVKAKRSKRN